MGKIKDRLYNYFVRKNGRVWYEYERYVREHMEEHRLHRFKHIRLLMKLNWFYRVKKGSTPYLYWDVELEPSDDKKIDYLQDIKTDLKINVKLEFPNVEMIFIENDIIFTWNKKRENEVHFLIKKEKCDWTFVEATADNYFKILPQIEGKYMVVTYENGLVSDYLNGQPLEIKPQYKKLDELKVKTIELDGQLILLWNKISNFITVNVYIEEESELKFLKTVNGQGTTVYELNNEQQYCIHLRCVYNNQEKNETIITGTPRQDQSSIIQLEKLSNKKNELLKLCSKSDEDDNLIMAESLYKARPYPHVFAKELIKYDICVFDIFDTVIFRPFNDPKDLFYLLEDQFSILNFCEIRKNCEKKARNKKKAFVNNEEVTIDEIYSEIEFETGLNAEEGALTEFNLEMEMCFANPYMCRLIEILKAIGKTIVFASDMYYSSEQIKTILKKCGIPYDIKIFSSCDFSASKRDGELFKIIMNEFGKQASYFLIDDKLNNIKAARDCGWSRHQYISVSEKAKTSKQCVELMSKLIGSAYAGVVNARLNNGIKHYSEQYEYGYKCGGIYVLGFCNWLNKKCKKENIEKIIFVSRDGSIYKQCFDQYFKNCDTEYLYWSRLVAVRLASEYNRNLFFDLSLYSNLNKITIKELFCMLGIEKVSRLLVKYRITENSTICESNIEILKSLFVENWEEIFEENKKEQLIAEQYVKKIVGSAKRIALVDVGWKGANLLGLEWFIKEKCNKNIFVKCYLAAINSNTNLSFNMSKKIESYLFSSLHNVDLLRQHEKTNYGFNNMFFELLSQDIAPSTRGFKFDEEFEICFSISEPENKEFILEIKQGINDFISDYISHFAKKDYMLNISGRDAYIPFCLFVKNSTYLIKYLSDYKFCREVYSGWANETIADIMLQNKNLKR